MDFAEYAERWREGLRGVAEIDDYGAVVEGGRKYALLAAGRLAAGAPSLIVTAGFHGDEKAGPLTLLAHAAELFAYARAQGVGLRLYPCLNPSGFEAHTRYNGSGERPSVVHLPSRCSGPRDRSVSTNPCSSRAAHPVSQPD